MRPELRRPDEREEIAAEVTEMYTNDGWSIRRVARGYGVSFGTARKLLLEGGATLRKRGGPNRAAK